MPNLQAFGGVSQGWINQIVAISSSAVRDAIEEGASSMREGILDSPTNDKRGWHKRKNDANNFPEGARIGNTNATFGDVDPKSGLMLASVDSLGPVKTGGGGEVEGFFGWIDRKEPYFLLQDVGNYGVGSQTGMGLLNSVMGEGNSVTNYSAFIASQQKLIKSLSAAGLKPSGGIGGTR